MSEDAAWRFVERRPGMKGFFFGYTIGKLLPQRTPVKVLYRVSPIHIEVGYGRDWQKTVQEDNVDCGREWRTGKGEWIPESDPRVREWLLKVLADARAGGTKLKEFRSTESRKMDVEEVEWILQRNGWRVPPNPR